MNARSPFDLDATAAYADWREQRLASAPSSIDDIIVEVGDPRALSPSEHKAMLAILRRANMVIYAGPAGANQQRNISQSIGARFGLKRLDHHLLTEDDGVSTLTVAESGRHTDFLPYTNRAMGWHTDGCYSPPEFTIRSMQLHCVQPAREGGRNRLLDHEIAYILLRDTNPAWIAALSQPTAMTIPPRLDGDVVARTAQTGPVFSVDPDGLLHMRYTSRRINISWCQDPTTQAAVTALESLLTSPTCEPWILSGRLEAGMGLLCNNILHDRTAFQDDVNAPRLLYRARYYDRIKVHAAG